MFKDYYQAWLLERSKFPEWEHIHVKVRLIVGGCSVVGFLATKADIITSVASLLGLVGDLKTYCLPEHAHQSCVGEQRIRADDGRLAYPANVVQPQVTQAAGWTPLKAAVLNAMFDCVMNYATASQFISYNPFT